MSEDVTKWLKDLDLGQHADAFEENEITWEVLPSLDHDLLKELGVKAIGQRVRILNAIAALTGIPDAPPDSSEPSAPANIADNTLAAWERHPGERKPVTMLFADITGSTALTEKLDVEEAHDLLYGATQRMCAAVDRNRCTVCRFMGDGVMAMFGAPVASEYRTTELFSLTAKTEHPIIRGQR